MKRWIVAGIAGIVVIGVWAGAVRMKSAQPPVRTGVKSLSVDDFSVVAARPGAFIVDVHVPVQPHIPGTDAVIPYTDVASRRSEFPQDTHAPIIVYCRSGSMSRTAAETLVSLGYTDVYDLTGGTNAYKMSHQIVAMTPQQRGLGTVVYGEIPTAEFTLTNYTPNPLVITRVSTSCGCTTASIERKDLAPYESTTVHVSFNPAVHKDDTDLGQITRTIYIDTDNQNFRQVTAEITALVVRK